MRHFLEFVDKRQRDAKKHLKLVEKMLKKNGMDVKSFLEEDEPYLFVKATNEKLSFEGIRIYEIASAMAYRIQKESKTHPYGLAYSLNIEEMFNDFMGDNIGEEKAAKKVIESTVGEIKKFFKKSAEAEDDLNNSSVMMGDKHLLRTGGTDYSSLVINKM